VRLGAKTSSRITILRRKSCRHIYTSLKDKENDRHVLGEANILEKISDNQYFAEYKKNYVIVWLWLLRPRGMNK
jgi:hypothetical protein